MGAAMTAGVPSPRCLRHTPLGYENAQGTDSMKRKLKRYSFEDGAILHYLEKNADAESELRDKVASGLSPKGKKLARRWNPSAGLKAPTTVAKTTGKRITKASGRRQILRKTA